MRKREKSYWRKAERKALAEVVNETDYYWMHDAKGGLGDLVERRNEGVMEGMEFIEWSTRKWGSGLLGDDVLMAEG